MYAFTSDIIRQQAEARSEAIRARAEYDKTVTRQNAMAEAWDAVEKAEADCRNAKGKVARKEAKKALAYADWVWKTMNDPKFKV
jgi:hypothetical protein